MTSEFKGIYKEAVKKKNQDFGKGEGTWSQVTGQSQGKRVTMWRALDLNSICDFGKVNNLSKPVYLYIKIG